MTRIDSSATCAYCAKPTLVGGEPPEHALPAAINARFTTSAVCSACNLWAGEEIDRPWLADPYVRHVRVMHQIPDRRGTTLEHDPLLRGVTADGTHVAMGRDGRPVALNSPIKRDPESGTVQIRARDQA